VGKKLQESSSRWIARNILSASSACAGALSIIRIKRPTGGTGPVSPEASAAKAERPEKAFVVDVEALAEPAFPAAWAVRAAQEVRVPTDS
jgi:hypothetical protein